MRMMKSVLAVLLVIMGVSGFADAKARGRIDVSGTGGNVVLTPKKNPAGGYSLNPDWAGVNKSKYIASESAILKTGDWHDYSMSFIPAEDGKVDIILAGVWHAEKGASKPVPVWVIWDKIEVQGADIVNGDLLRIDAEGKPEGWKLKEENCLEADGKKYLKTWHNSKALQTITVKKGQEVTISAKVKKAE